MIRFSFRVDLEFEDSAANGHGGLESFHRWTEESLADFCTGYCKGRRAVRRLEPAAWFLDPSAQTCGPDGWPEKPRCPSCHHDAHPDLVCGFRQDPKGPACMCIAMDTPARLPHYLKTAPAPEGFASFPVTPKYRVDPEIVCPTCSGDHDERDCPNVSHEPPKSAPVRVNRWFEILCPTPLHLVVWLVGGFFLGFAVCKLLNH